MEKSENSLKNDLKDSTETEKSTNDFKFDELHSRKNAQLQELAEPENTFKLKRFIVVVLAFAGIWGASNLVSDFSLPFFTESDKEIIEEAVGTERKVEEDAATVSIVPSNSSYEGNYVDYLTALKEANLFENYEGFERQAFYEASVNVAYLTSLHENGFTDGESIPFHQIIAYYNAGISTDDLLDFKENGLFTLLEFHELIAFYNADISLAKLLEFKELGFLDRFEFHELIGFENNGISINYIQELEKAELLNDIEFFEIIHFWQNEVSVSYLTSLKEKGLLSDLTFYEISKMFKDSSN